MTPMRRMLVRTLCVMYSPSFNTNVELSVVESPIDQVVKSDVIKFTVDAIIPDVLMLIAVDSVMPDVMSFTVDTISFEVAVVLLDIL